LITDFGGRSQSTRVTYSSASTSLAAPVPDARTEEISPSYAPVSSVVPRLSLRDVHQAHFPFVWRTLKRLHVPASSIDDVAQEIFIVLWRRLPEYDGRASLRSWLYGITVRVVSEHRRRFRRLEARFVQQEVDDHGEVLHPSSHPPPSEAVEQSQQVALMAALLEKLEPEKREVLVLAQLEQMTVPEIAERLGANVNTVYSRLRAAKREFDEAYARHRARRPWSCP